MCGMSSNVDPFPDTIMNLHVNCLFLDLICTLYFPTMHKYVVFDAQHVQMFDVWHV